jgi:hypothetical protein
VTAGAARGARTSAVQLSERDLQGLLFTAEMYGLQLDLLAGLLGLREDAARRVVARWRRLGYADTARLGPGRPWVWLTRRGLGACGLRYTAVPPALSRLAHIRAVTVIRLALESAPSYRQSEAYWRSERRLRARMGGRVGLREHLPDGEIHFPALLAGTPPDGSAFLAGTPPDGKGNGDGCALPYAGECWAVEAELSRKTVARTASIMRELLARTGDYGCPAAEAAVLGRPARHTRVLYLCSAAARPTVARAAAELGPLAARIEIRSLPAAAAFDEVPAP